jgi:hypothetical protein
VLCVIIGGLAVKVSPGKNKQTVKKTKAAPESVAAETQPAGKRPAKKKMAASSVTVEGI